MNLTMTITLDGLVRALCWQVHDLAEDLEQRYPRGGRAAASDAREGRAKLPERAGEHDDDIASR